MSTFVILLVVSVLAVVVSACEGPAASGQGNALSSAASTPPDIGPPPSQASPMAVVVGPSGLHAR
jgi:hypothetical protein